MGNALAQLVEVMRYKRQGRGFDCQWDQWLNPRGRVMVLGYTQPLNRNECGRDVLGSKGGRCV